MYIHAWLCNILVKRVHNHMTQQEPEVSELNELHDSSSFKYANSSDEVAPTPPLNASWWKSLIFRASSGCCHACIGSFFPRFDDVSSLKT